MENNNKLTKFNKKLLVMFFLMIAIFTTLLVSRAKAFEIVSSKQTDRGDPIYLTYEDLMSYYDILCCQHGQALKGSATGGLTGEFDGHSFSLDMSHWAPDYGVGSEIEEITLTNGESKSIGKTFTHQTLGYYSKSFGDGESGHICTPKEAYIIAEMKNEAKGMMVEVDGELSNQPYTGSFINSLEIPLSNGERVYTVNHEYVVKTNKGNYYVEFAKDTNGNPYYKYKYENGNKVEYTGDFTYEQEGTGAEVECEAAYISEIYDENGNKEVINGNCLYLLSYDIVKLDDNGDAYYTYVSGGGNYIQVAWWSTSRGGGNDSSTPNDLSQEALAFQNYILDIAGVNSVSQLKYEEQEYTVTEADGTTSSGTITAPVINYNPGFNEDANQDGEINTLDEITASFDPNTQKYVVGPFSVDYIKSSAQCGSRPRVDFAGIDKVTLVGNVNGESKELILNSQWNFKFLVDQGRDLDEDYQYPNPNEIFYIEINYMEGLTSIEDFGFYFKYMNAGGIVDVYDGVYYDVTWTVKGDSPIYETKYEWDGTYEKDSSGEFKRDSYGNLIQHKVPVRRFKSQKVWLECTEAVEHDSQTLAHALIGVRWYNYAECHKEFNLQQKPITIEKTILMKDSNGKEIIPKDGVYQFEVYINDELFQTLTIQTLRGVGRATTQPYVWTEDEAPRYRVVEIGDYDNNGPWEGTLGDDKQIVVKAENYITPKTGRLEIDKKLVGDTPLIEGEEFNFNVTLSGMFGYDGKPISDHTETIPVKIDYKVAQSWTSDEIEWLGDAPTYNVEEIIPDGALYELVNGTVDNGKGSLKADDTVVATATNQPITEQTIIHLDKKMLSSTTPKVGEEFKVTVIIKGEFAYGDEEIKDYSLEGLAISNCEDGTILLNSDNDWSFDSKVIRWKKGNVPTYEVSEVSMSDGTDFFSISDEKITDQVNNFHSELNPEATNVVITNDYNSHKMIGKLKIKKMSATSDLAGETFRFKVNVFGDFEYDGETYNSTPENPFEEIVDITLPESPNGILRAPTAEAKLKSFIWNEGVEAPRYTVEELGMVQPNGDANFEGCEFVSIERPGKVETSSRTISGSLSGTKLENSESKNEPTAQVVVTCINRGRTEEPVYGHLVIDKESTDESIDGLVFEFRVTIWGKFKYWNNVENGKPVATSYGYDGDATDTLVLNGLADGVTAVCGGEDWISQMISWDKNDAAPQYKVEEIIPDDREFEFVQMSVDNRITNVPVISGTIRENNEFIYVRAINEPDDHDGPGGDSLRHSLKITKRLEGKTQIKKFLFDLTVQGEFEYNGITYGKESNNGDTYELKNIVIDFSNVNTDTTDTVNNYWLSGEFIWNEGTDAPKYTVREVGGLKEGGDPSNEADIIKPCNEDNYDTEPGVDENGVATGYRFISIGAENVSKKSTNSKERKISGRLDSDRMIEVKAINRGKTEDGGHIQIVKKVLTNELKGEPFHFRVEITSEDSFIYHDKDNGTSGTRYDPSGDKPAKLVIEDAVAVADGLDWFSEYIEWNLDNKASGYAIPHYKISEITGEFPNGVESVSIENDEGKITKKLNNASEEDLVIEGTMNGDVTQIIAINDKPTQLKGKLVVEKRVDAVPDDFTEETFYFDITVSGKFKYGDEEYKEYTKENPLKFDKQPIKVTKDENGNIIKGEWESEEFTWYENDEAPEYKVEEVDLPTTWEFVSISNETYMEKADSENTEAKMYVEGTLKGEKIESENSPIGQVLVTCINKKGEIHEGELVIYKWGQNDALDGVPFHFDVKIYGVFKYYNGDDGQYTQVGYINDKGEQVKETLELKADAIARGADWVSSIMTWEDGVDNPTYEVTEVDIPAGCKFVSIQNDEQGIVTTEPKISGTIDEGRESNYVRADNTGEGTNSSIRITKTLQGEVEGNNEFKFEVKIIAEEGPFDYEGVHYDIGQTAILTPSITVNPETGIGTWESSKVLWDKPVNGAEEKIPKYEVTETDSGKAEFVSISDDDELHDADDKNKTVSGLLNSERTVNISAINKGDIDYPKGRIEITKDFENDELYNQLSEEDRTFYFDVTVTSEKPFKYYQAEEGFNSEETTEKKFESVPVVAGGEDWISGFFEWGKDDPAPKYTITELHSKFPDGVESVYIRDDNEQHNLVLTNKSGNEETLTVTGQLVGARKNDGAANAVGVHVFALNNKTTELKGKLNIQKLVETAPDDFVSGTFKFDIIVNGKFSYEGKKYDGEKTFDNQAITVKKDENGVIKGEWTSKEFTWEESDGAPTYTIQEVELPKEWEFISLSNEEGKVDNIDTPLEGTLNGEKVEGENSPCGQSVITCKNKSGIPTTGELVIIKKSLNDSLDGTPFNFKVTIEGIFDYYDQPNGGYRHIADKDAEGNEIPGSIELPAVAICGRADWISSIMKWNKGVAAPTYKVEEVDIPEGCKFVSIENDEEGVVTDRQYVEGTIDEGREFNYVTAINDSDKDTNGSIKIIKELRGNSDTKEFEFSVTINGDFYYEGKHYTEEDNPNGYTINPTITVNEVYGIGTWISGNVLWDDGKPAPTYTVKEVSEPVENNDLSNLVDNNKNGIADGFVFTSISSSDGGMNPDYTDRSVSGTLSSDTTVLVDAINTGGGTEDTVKGRIEITKEVRNEALKGTMFYFDVKVSSETENFIYRPENGSSNAVTYGPGNPFKMTVEVEADGRDWISGFFEWDLDGDGVYTAPEYKITELHAKFPDGVESVYIKDDNELHNLVLTNKSGNEETLTVTGQLLGANDPDGVGSGVGVHVTALNDIPEETLKGKLTIEKKALSKIIEGEEFTFTATISGTFKYNGTQYKNETLTIENIKIKANGPDWTPEQINEEIWESQIIEWNKKDSNPRYTVTEEEAKFANGVEFVSIRNAEQTNTEPTIQGTIEPGDTITTGINWVIAENTIPEPEKGRLQIHKILMDENGNEIEGLEFNFKIKLDFYDRDGNLSNSQEIDKTIVSGQIWRSDWYTWNKGETVKYHIEEINHEGYEVEFVEDENNKTGINDKTGEPYVEGTLVAQNSETGENGISFVTATNTYTKKYSAKIQVNKKLILNDKISEDDVDVGFKVLVNVSGRFTYKGVAYGDSENNGVLTLEVTLNKDSKWTWTSDEISWIEGASEPTFTVEEKDIPDGWHLVGTEIIPNDSKLHDKQTSVVNITNEWDYNEQLLLTMKLGGKVWDDTNRTLDKHVDALENGIIDDGESGIPNVKVTVYRALADKSTGEIVQRLDGVYAYDENDLSVAIENYTYTDQTGNWSFGAISVPAFVTEQEKILYGEKYVVTYDVEFEYDGQTYEPTEFLATASTDNDPKDYEGANSSNNMYTKIKDRWSTIINSSTADKDKYLNDSSVIDKLEDRQKFNSDFADIQGKEAMDGDGKTLGQTGSGKELHYSSTDTVSVMTGDNSRKVSTLDTYDENGNMYDELKMVSATSNANLTYPFYNVDPNHDYSAWHLRSWDKTLTDVFKMTYRYDAVYNYCLSINLGLVEREAADVAVEKDLTEALVVVNGKAIKYKFNEAIDLEDPNYKELLYKQLAVADAQIEYKLGLYKGDYYYRADVYNGDVKDALENFYTRTLHLPSIGYSEMEVYLKYTINVYNQSETYDVDIGEIADYYDSSVELIENPEERYVEVINNKKVENQTVEDTGSNENSGLMTVAEPSTITYYDSNEEVKNTIDLGWSKVEGEISGSDGIKYNKIVTNVGKLASNERASITATFKVTKVNESGIADVISLGQKHNVAEVTKFTSYYSENSENRWSSPDDISGRVDEDSAPDNVNITNYNEKTYYEDDTDSAPIITIGLSDENRAITGIVWDDAQTDDAGLGQTVGDGIYSPKQGDKLISGLTTELYEIIRVPKSSGDGYEEYYFKWPTNSNIPDSNVTIKDKTGFSSETTTDANGVYKFINMPAGNYKVRYVYGDKKIETGNEDSVVVYNGQDYKTTAYQIGFDNDRDDDGYVDNEWHDINNEKLNSLRVNDARDDEARRLYISAKSEMLTHDNTSLLSKADYKSDDYQGLFGNYQEAKNTDPIQGNGFYMYAETAKINLGVENVSDNMSEVDGKATQNGQDVGTSKFKYVVTNIDCGIEERSQSKLTLDKQIKQITLTTSDNKVLLDAVYDIQYNLKSDGTIAASVTLNEAKSTNSDHLASLNRNGNNQGYRYLIADSQILQGTTIQVRYQLTVFNMSETDRISSELEELWAKLDLTNVYDDNMVNAMGNLEFMDALDRVSTNEYTADGDRVYEGKPVGYGTYFGSVYYLGKQGVGVRSDETIVKTKVHQMIDYVDPDVEFTDMNNISKDQSWTNTNIDYLVNNHLIDTDIVKVVNKETGEVVGEYKEPQALADDERYSIISDKYQEYITDTKNNLILNMDNGENQDSGSNPGFVRFLEPYMAEKNVDKCTGTISLTVSRFYSSETDANDIDNLAEIIKVENTAGRRDARNIAGNANPCEVNEDNEPIGIYSVSVQGEEKDVSATEVITLSPPTGLSPEESRTMQLIIVVLISVTLVAVSIVIIKKKVLPKN